MSKTTYAEKLKDPRWQRKRLEIMSRDKFTCQDCDSTTETLHVHHRYYISKREPWDYPSFAYITNCEDCHNIHHKNIEHGKPEENIEQWEDAMDMMCLTPLDIDALSTIAYILAQIEANGGDRSAAIDLVVNYLETIRQNLRV